MKKKKADPTPETPVKLGRPTIYTEELGQKICKVVATHSLGLQKLCSMFQWMPDKTTINEWRWSIDSFSTQYTKAKIAQSELMAEDCIDIADDTSQDVTYNKLGDEICNTEFVNRSRLRVDTRKWIAAKLLPKIYGDMQKPADTEDGNKELREEMRALRAELDAKNKKEY
jgi:hypothetical protein